MLTADESIQKHADGPATAVVPYGWTNSEAKQFGIGCVIGNMSDGYVGVVHSPAKPKQSPELRERIRWHSCAFRSSVNANRCVMAVLLSQKEKRSLPPDGTDEHGNLPE